MSLWSLVMEQDRSSGITLDESVGLQYKGLDYLHC